MNGDPHENVKPKLLLVDDDPAVLRFITKITSSAGYLVSQAHDGREALNRILADCPDILVTDWEMPDIDGVELCREIRSRNLPFYVYILLLTAKSKPVEMVHALDVGADDFISKPVNKAVILARLKAAARTVELQHRLRRLGDSDPLTGALNRRAFYERLATEWERSERDRHELSCVMIDVDFFKKFNDTYGHAAGDTVLQAIVVTLEHLCRANDIFARFGGEEFCLILPETEEEVAVAWAERARAAIAQTTISFSGKSLNVTASFGVAARLLTTICPEALLDLADQSLHVAKESGRNQVVSFCMLADCGPDSSRFLGVYSPLDKAFARDVMAPAVYCPHQDELVGDVINMFMQLRLNAAPVVDDTGRLIGIISENDLLAIAASQRSLNVPIGSCMKSIFIQYNENTPAKEIFRFLSRASVPRVVVVNDSRPTGVVSRATLLHWLRNWANSHRSTDSPVEKHSPPMRQAAIEKITESASDDLQAFRHYLATGNAEIIPYAIAEATRLENLAQDILAHCADQDGL
jgi:diguanylate cyclase (GGDEF)-like protein